MTIRISLALAVVFGVLLLLTFERPPIDTVQRGFRGTAMVENFDPRRLATEIDKNKLPPTLPPVHAGGPASAAYQNVQVLGNLDVGAFTRLMATITTWVSPQQGCAYCHDVNNMASDALYTKVVARRMIQMVQHINSDWTNHVAQTGVSCWTCHRGQPVPAYVSYESTGSSHFTGQVETQTGKNIATPQVGYASLPYDPFTPYLEQNADIRVQSTSALPDGDRHSIKQTEWTYALMMHFAQSLGVNCTYCHNSREFGNWGESTPQRATAWYGIRMVRDLNAQYLGALHDVFPRTGSGAAGDSPKVNCATCHQGVYKPLFGVSPVQGFPELVHAPEAPPKT